MGKKIKQKKSTDKKIDKIVEEFAKSKDALYQGNVKNAYNGLKSGKIQIKIHSDGSLVAEIKSKKSCLGFEYYDELFDNYAARFEKIIKGKNIKVEEGYIVCSVEEFKKEFTLEEIAELIALHIETCDCMCSYSHFSGVLR